MIWLEAVLIFLFGLAVGSFLNVLIYRLPRTIPFVRGRSFCPHCKSSLRAADLVPLFSFLFLRGRCRYCRAPISWRYPLVELLSGTGLALLFISFDLTLLFCQWGILYLLLLPLFFIDLERQLLPDIITLPGVALGLAFNWGVGNWIAPLLGAAIGGGFFLLIALLWKGGMGGGDVKLALMVGAFIGYPLVLPWLLLSFIIGAMGGIVGMVAFKLKGKSAIPFGPYMATAAILTVYWGQALIQWYLELIGI